MRTRPPTFVGSVDPLEADDWLKNVEKKLILAQCNDQEKVMYATHQLNRTAGTWWENYCVAHQDVQTITWQEFFAAFRTAHIPKGRMEMKKREFLKLQ